MKLLFDTHSLIWFSANDRQLPQRARSAGRFEQFASATSAWEITAKFRKGKLQEAAFLVEAGAKFWPIIG